MYCKTDRESVSVCLRLVSDDNTEDAGVTKPEDGTAEMLPSAEGATYVKSCKYISSAAS